MPTKKAPRLTKTDAVLLFSADFFLNENVSDYLDVEYDGRFQDLVDDKNSQTHMKMLYHFEEDGFVLHGEADLFNPTIGFIDIKTTSDLEGSGWNDKKTIRDMLQSLTYPFLKYLGSGVIYPFYYVILCISPIQNVPPIIKVRKVEVKEKDFDAFLALCKKIANDTILEPDIGDYGENCTARKMGGYKRCACPFVNYCEVGRQLAGGFDAFAFEDFVNNEDEDWFYNLS